MFTKTFPGLSFSLKDDNEEEEPNFCFMNNAKNNELQEEKDANFWEKDNSLR